MIPSFPFVPAKERQMRGSPPGRLGTRQLGWAQLCSWLWCLCGGGAGHSGGEEAGQFHLQPSALCSSLVISQAEISQSAFERTDPSFTL